MRYDAKLLGLFLSLSVVAAGVRTSVRALPAPEPPRSQPAGASPEPAPTGATLPFGSPIFFVLDDAVNSATTPVGTSVRMHLREPLVVNRITLAPAGTRGSFSVVSTRKAQSGDVDGAVQIYVDPVTLPARNLTLPLRAVHEYLTRELTAGQQSTRAATDTVSDVFVPYAMLFQVLRKGHQMVMPVGTVLRAETAATIDATNPANVVLATPPPFVSNYDSPHSDLTPAPFFTPAPEAPHPLRKGKPTVPPSSPGPPAPASPSAPDSPSSPSASLPSASSPLPSESPLPMPVPSATSSQGPAALALQQSRMNVRAVTLVALAASISLPSLAHAADASGKPTAAEAPFVAAVVKDLSARFATPADAERAGYLRYTDEDDTGAISYANRKWSSADAAHPSQLWYDVNGRLLGADYSEPQAGGPPQLFGLEADRWQKFGLHVHYGIAGSGTSTTFGATGPKKMTPIGANAESPTKADLVKLGLAKSEADVRFVFAFPAIYDVSVWVRPNPDGAFAEKNPDVKPVHPPKDAM